MKQIKLTLFLLLTVSIAFAQKSKVNQASAQLSAGKVDVAKEAIDEDLKANDEKTKDWYKAWLVRGQVYRGICESPLPAYKELDNNAVEKSWEAYQKAIEFAKNEKKPEKILPKIYEDIFNPEKPDEPSLKQCFITKGATEFQEEKDFVAAFKSFETALSFNKLVGAEVVDSVIIYYTALSYDNAGNNCKDEAKKEKYHQKAKEYYSKAIEIGYEAEKCYVFKSTVQTKLGDKEGALKTINEGLKAYPSSGLIIGSMINYYIQNNELDKALVSVSKAIEEGNDDPSYLYTKGALLDKQAEGIADEAKKFNLDVVQETKKEVFRKRNEPSSVLKPIKDRYEKEKAKLKAMDDKSEKIYNEAIEMYDKTLAKKADYFDAAYNKGAVYYNLGSKYEVRANAINPSNDPDGSKFKAADDKAKGFYKKSLQSFLKANEIKANDKFTLTNLKNIYYKLKMMDKYKEMKEKIDNL